MVLAVGIGTYLIRISGVALLGPQRRLPARVELGLRMVAPSVLAALVATTLFGEGDGWRDLGAWHGAAAVAAIVAVQTRSAAWTLAAGMVAVWTFSALG